MRPLLVVSLALLAAGCLRLKDVAPFTCSSDSDCESGEGCLLKLDSNEGVCRPEAYCDTKYQCDENELCVEHTCQPIECMDYGPPTCGGYACEVEIGKCLTRCADDKDCEDRFTCGAGECVETYCDRESAARFCQGYGCGLEGLCKTSCSDPYDCAEGSLCSETQCVPSCTELSDPLCGDYRCDVEATICRTACDSEYDCNQGLFCHVEQCVDAATIAGFCQEDEDCTGYLCSRGEHVCQDRCDFDQDCNDSAGYRCADEQCKLEPRLSPRADLAAGDYFTCAIVEGETQCWGTLPTGGADDIPQPSLTFVRLSAGAEHVCGVTGSGNAICWGTNRNGRSGEQWFDAVAVSAGGKFSCVLESLGTAHCVPSYFSSIVVPFDAPKLTTITAGESFACGIDEDGRVYCWGEFTAPTESDIEAIDAGGNHLCGLTRDKKVVCWGDDTLGQTSVPRAAAQAEQVTAGSRHSCALLKSGKAVCWGDDGYDQRKVPADAPTFVRLSAGLEHTCGQTAAGKIVCWGADGYGQSTVPADLAP